MAGSGRAFLLGDASVPKVHGDGLQHRIALFDGSGGVPCGRIRPVAGISGLDGPLGQFRQVCTGVFDKPPVRQEIAQCVQVVRLWKIDLHQYQARLNRLLGRLLGQPAGVPRNG